MGGHRTKDQGDVAPAEAHADLAGQRFSVLVSATEHSAFDLVASTNGTFHRVQVEFRSARAQPITVQSSLRLPGTMDGHVAS